MPTSGTLTNLGQKDWLAVTLTANQAYEFTITGGASLEVGTADGLSADGTFSTSFPDALLNAGGTSGTSHAYFMPSVSGVYYVDVSNVGAVVPDNYTVSVVTTTADHTDNPTQPGTLKVGGMASGTLTNLGQKDWLAVTLTANQAYEFTITGGASLEVGTADGLSADGTFSTSFPDALLNAGGTSGTSHAYFMPSVSGVYYVDVSNVGAVVPDNYTVSVVTTTADHTDNPTQPGTLKVGGMASGTLTNLGQKDWLAVTLTANQAYEFTITGGASLEVGTADGLSADGTFSTSFPDALLNAGGTSGTSHAYFMPSVSGVYYVDVSNVGAVVPDNYTVSVVTTTADHTDNPTQPGTLKVGGMASGTLTNLGQKDWLAVTLTANQAYEFTITGGASLEVGTADGLSADGTFSTSFPDALLNAGGTSGTSHAYFMPSVSGVYYVDVSNVGAVVPDNYTVSVVTTTADHTDNPTQPGTLKVGGMASGTLTNLGQKDWLAVTLTANQAYEFTITGGASLEVGTADGLSADGTFSTSFPDALLNAGGTSGTSHAYFMPSVSGVYYVDVSNVGAVVPDNYTVSVVTTTADHTDNPTQPGTLTVGGSALSHVSDFYGNGTSDILWRNTSGAVDVWTIGNGQLASSAVIGSLDNSWQIAGTGDFNGNGTDDILWHNTSGAVDVWTMSNGQLASSAVIGGADNSWQIVGTGDFNGKGTDDILWRNTSGAVDVWTIGNGQLASSAVIGSLDNSWQIVGTGDFNGNGTDDILWHNTSGAVDIWTMSNGRLASSAVIGGADNSWQIVGTGDFNGNGTDDILWRNTSGAVDVWTMSNGQLASSAVIGSLDNSWQIAGTGDFNGNGTDDILWHNTSGAVDIWTMSNGQLASSAVIGGADNSWQISTSQETEHAETDILWRNTSGAVDVWTMSNGQLTSSTVIGSLDNSWQIAGTGDFNGNGTDDILWRNTSGAVDVWTMSNGRLVSSAVIGGADNSWQIAGTGDFNGDGTDDILWRNTSGAVDVWTMSNGQLGASTVTGSLDNSWQIAGTGDFNGNGTDDILWHNTSGAVDVWTMSNGRLVSSAVIGGADSSWQIAGTGDFNGDGTDDILWRNTSGAVDVWTMSNGQLTSSTVIGSLDNSWQIAGTGDFNGNGTDDILWRNTSGAVDVWTMSNGRLVSSAVIGGADNSWLIQHTGLNVYI